MGLTLLVAEGNAREEREAQRAAYGASASEAYANCLREIAPEARIDLCFPADPGANTLDSGGLETYDGVFITGSALNLYDGGPEISRQVELARAIFAAGAPFFGSCWGLQVACAAAGGLVMPNPKGREIGVARKIAPSAEGAIHPMLKGRPAAYDAPCTHLDIVVLPDVGAVALAGNAFCPVQAAEIRYDCGVFWGVQYHPEYSLTTLAAIIARRTERLAGEGIVEGPEACARYCADLRALDSEPSRADIAWRIGVDEDMTDPRRRRTELANFLEAFVRPEQSRRGRG
jgi:GMP synthase (glutamine-hydrolysing)